MNREIIAQAEQAGKGTEAQQMVQETTANQSGVLTQARNQLQMQVSNEGSSDTPLQSRVQEQERLMTGSGEEEEQPATTTTGQFKYGSDAIQPVDSTITLTETNNVGNTVTGNTSDDTGGGTDTTGGENGGTQNTGGYGKN